MGLTPQASSAASPSSPVAPVTTALGDALRRRAKSIAARRPHVVLGALVVLAAVLNLWALGKNGWANDYYSAAVRSMSSSWHNFLFASADPSGLMTLDKPPLALWVQSLSVRVFGYHPLSMLVPQALMGVASVVLVYDLVRRRFGRVGGFVAGLALALTPMTVAISRHNNPDALLVLCCVAAMWCAMRALENGRTCWLVLAGVCVGLGFETKMLVALVVVPAIVLAYMLVAPRGRLRAVRQLLAGGVAMALVGGAWPALMALTPASERPWISGTSDNSVFSLIFEYNGLGRVDGQAGGPAGAAGRGGGGGTMFGGSTGPLRLLNSALGGQAGWLLGIALVSAIGLLVASRLRRADARSGWLVSVGGAFLTTAALFSFATGIFHPYYVSLLAPFAAALVGAGAAQMLGGGRVLAPLALAGGVVTELIVLNDYPGQLSWLPPVLIAACAPAAFALVLARSKRARLTAAGVGIGALLLAPSVWALDTLGHATSGTFPEGGPGNVQTAGGRGTFAGFDGRTGTAGVVRLFGTGAAQAGGPPSGLGSVPGTGPGGPSAAGGAGGARTGMPPGIAGGAGGGARAGFGGGPGGAFGGERALTHVLSYVKQHGGGTIAVSSQSSAAVSIIASNADVAGIGGFSGRESNVSVAWLAAKVSSGSIRWVLGEQTGAQGAGPRRPGDTRAGSEAALTAVAKACRRVTVATSTSTATASGATGASSTLYDCQGRAAALQSGGG